jgi:hypothetical protein
VLLLKAHCISWNPETVYQPHKVENHKNEFS